MLTLAFSGNVVPEILGQEHLVDLRVAHACIHLTLSQGASLPDHLEKYLEPTPTL